MGRSPGKPLGRPRDSRGRSSTRQGHRLHLEGPAGYHDSGFRITATQPQGGEAVARELHPVELAHRASMRMCDRRALAFQTRRQILVSALANPSLAAPRWAPDQGYAWSRSHRRAEPQNTGHSTVLRLRHRADPDDDLETVFTNSRFGVARCRTQIAIPSPTSSRASVTPRLRSRPMCVDFSIFRQHDSRFLKPLQYTAGSYLPDTGSRKHEEIRRHPTSRRAKSWKARRRSTSHPPACSPRIQQHYMQTPSNASVHTQTPRMERSPEHRAPGDNPAGP